jgi:hypothetical protein
MAKRKPKPDSYECVGGPIDGDMIPATDLRAGHKFGALTHQDIVHVYDLKAGKLIYNRDYYFKVEDGKDKQPRKRRKW